MPSTRTTPGVRLTLFKDEKATSGEPLDLSTRLLSMSFEDCDDKADKLSLQLDNFDLAMFDREDITGGGVDVNDDVNMVDHALTKARKLAQRDWIAEPSSR